MGKTASPREPALKPTQMSRFADPFSLELERCAIPDIAADVFLVDENLVNRAARPRPAQIGENAPRIVFSCDVALGFLGIDEGSIDAPHDLDFMGWPRDKNDPVRLDTLMFTPRQQPLGCLALIDELAPEPVAGRTGLSVTKFDQAALAIEHLGRKLTAKQ